MKSNPDLYFNCATVSSVFLSCFLYDKVPRNTEHQNRSRSLSLLLSDQLILVSCFLYLSDCFFRFLKLLKFVMCFSILSHENILTPLGCMLVPLPVFYLKNFLKRQKNYVTLIFISVDIRCSCGIIIVFLLYDCVSLQFTKILLYTCSTKPIFII